MADKRLAPKPPEIAGLGAALALIGTALLLVLTPSTVAQEQAPSDAAAFLQTMARAERATYQARQLVVFFGDPQSAALLEVRSSPTGQFVRAESGGKITRYWRRADIGLVSGQRERISEVAPLDVGLRPGSVLAKYDIELEAPQKIFDVGVVPLVLVRRSDRTTVERLWVEPASGVVYRRELYGSGGKLVGMSTVLDMKWGEVRTDDPVEPEPASIRVESTRAKAPAMLPNGYRLLGTYLIRSRGARPADHWVYSDGMHALSVFRTAGQLKAPSDFVETKLDGSRAWVGPGPGTWAWEGGGASWVVVAEETSLDPAILTAGLPRGGPSVWARLGTVWARAFRAVGALFG